MRSDVLVKIELLDQKHVQDIVFQLQRLVTAMSKYHNDCQVVLKEADVFPIEVDLARSTFTYDTSNQFNDNEEDEEEEEEGTDTARNQTGAFSGDLISTD
ncbi:PRKCA-binding protein-like [Lingula anatina]|nr:PRKCA-binding protein-like [Lingula anatina]|eukprot:XP_013383872.1 PRKCA-binding protein-like [Lingula anatina]